ncbi:metallophosphoesterase [Bifidobacterium samirii]|uniref:metallophosphoesterase n=1 Tax=Bifidobacterium samirii TaxID=2306974 RepID=UPI000F7E54DE|nr:metallophosphoesterase [Bifidobacterium samirii]
MSSPQHDGQPVPAPPHPAGRHARHTAPHRAGSTDRILFSGDIHCKGRRLCPLIEAAADRVDAGTIVLLGDLLNEHGITADGEVRAFEQLVEWVERQRRVRDVVVLLGNHDLTYWADSDTANHHAFKGTCPGYLERAYPDVHYLLHAVRPQLAYGFTDACGRRVVASHAGVTQGWWDWMKELLHDAGEPVPSPAASAEAVAARINAFAEGRVGGGIRPFGIMVGPERGGWYGDTPSPVWAGMEEIARDPLVGFDQIVAHTPVETVLHRHCGDGTGMDGCADEGRVGRRPGRHAGCRRDGSACLWYCDTHSRYRDGRAIGDDSLLLYDRSAGRAWSVRG